MPKTTTPRIPALTPEQLGKLRDFVLRESAAGEVRSTLNIGNYLYAQVFRSSEEAFRSKDPCKSASLRALAAQDGMADAGWDHQKLGNSIELALMAKKHNDFRAWRFLRVSHYEEVIGLEPEKQRALLDQADQGKWTVARLNEEVGKAKPPRPAPAPGSAKPEKALGRVRKAMGEATALAKEGTDLGPCLVEAGLDGGEAAKFSAKMDEAVAVLQGIQKQLVELKQRSVKKLRRAVKKVTTRK